LILNDASAQQREWVNPVHAHAFQVYQNRDIACAAGAFRLPSAGIIAEVSPQRSLRSRVFGTNARSAEDYARTEKKRMSELEVAVFSCQNYMADNVSRMFQEQCGKGVHMCDLKLDDRTALIAKDCEAINIFVNDECGRDTIEVLADCGVKLITLRCAGYNNVDVDAAAEHGMLVARVPTYAPESIAEHAAALLLSLSRKIHLTYARTRMGNFALSGLLGFQIHGKTVGVNGTGNIGLAAIRIFKGFGARVVACDPFPRHDKAAEIGFEYMDFDDVLAHSDILSLHCPLVESTQHLINDASIAKMKPGMIIINTSRGGLVETDALIKGMRDFRVGAYGTDVYENEEKIFFKDMTQFEPKHQLPHWDRAFNELMSLPNVLVTPHQAFLTEEALTNIGETTMFNLHEYCSGKESLTNACVPSEGIEFGSKLRARR